MKTNALQHPSLASAGASLPESSFYVWKRDLFHAQIEDELMSSDQPFDAMCVRMAKKADRERRILAVVEESTEMGMEYFMSLSNSQSAGGIFGSASLSSTSDGQGGRASRGSFGTESSLLSEGPSVGKKRPLGMKQKRVLRHNAGNRTTHLDFHPYDEILAVCDDSDGIVFWDVGTGKKRATVSNGNKTGTRFTSSCWLDTDTQSLFVAGCDDGSIRIWGDLFGDSTDTDPERRRAHPMGRTRPTLQSAFRGVPDLASDNLESDLVLTWQHHRGQIVASGGTKPLCCWDVESEKKTGELDTGCNAPITSIETPWVDRYVMSQPSSAYLNGLGPNVVATGFADGTVKMFDLRQTDPAVHFHMASLSHGRQHSFRHTEYHEHDNWVVAVGSTNYDDRLEIVSSCVSGKMKIWDLRSTSKSLRSYTVQQSPMTAFAVHRRIPVVASGSHAQFIKLMSLEGEALQVIRFHEDRAGERIGPVGYLSMHRNRALLAAGGTDSFVTVYARKEA